MCNRNWGCGKGRKIFDMKICKEGSLEKQCVDGNKPQDNRI